MWCIEQAGLEEFLIGKEENLKEKLSCKTKFTDLRGLIYPKTLAVCKLSIICLGTWKE